MRQRNQVGSIDGQGRHMETWHLILSTLNMDNNNNLSYEIICVDFNHI